jgi:hypothetical protein
MITLYQPDEGSLPERVCRWLAGNRDERLSARDITAKFDCPPGSVHAGLKSALEHGWLRRQGSDFMAGPNLPAGSQASTAQHAAQAIARPTPRKPRAAPVRPLPDSALTVEANVPMPPVKGVERTNWPALFAKLTKPGLCSAPLPAAYRGALQKAAKEWSKQRGGGYAIRAVSDEHIRIWRTE